MNRMQKVIAVIVVVIGGLLVEVICVAATSGLSSMSHQGHVYSPAMGK